MNGLVERMKEEARALERKGTQVSVDEEYGNIYIRKGLVSRQGKILCTYDQKGKMFHQKMNGEVIMHVDGDYLHRGIQGEVVGRMSDQHFNLLEYLIGAK